MEPGQWVVITGLLLTFLTTVLTSLFNAHRDNKKYQQTLEREERNRRWDLEDRQHRAEEDRKDRERIAARELHESKEIASQVIIQQANVAQKVEERLTREAKIVLDSLVLENEKAELARQQLAEMIEANTRISTQAFEEANTVNKKIEKLGLEHNALQRDKAESQEAMGEVVQATHEKVIEIHEEVTGGEPTTEKDKTV